MRDQDNCRGRVFGRDEIQVHSGVDLKGDVDQREEIGTAGAHIAY